LHEVSGPDRRRSIEVGDQQGFDPWSSKSSTIMVLRPASMALADMAKTEMPGGSSEG
jgi:hypothetical protein